MKYRLLVDTFFRPKGSIFTKCGCKKTHYICDGVYFTTDYIKKHPEMFEEVKC